MIHRFLWLVLIFILSSCAQSPPVPDDHFYRMPWTHADLPMVKLTDGVIFVDNFIADGLYRERALIHAVDRSGLELKQYHYHHWIDTPARMLRDQLIRYLTESNVAVQVVDDSTIPYDIAIFGKIRSFERHKHGINDRIKVELEFRVDKTGERLPISVLTYNVQIDVHEDSMNEVVSAYGVALSQLFAQLLEDLGTKLNR